MHGSWINRHCNVRRLQLLEEIGTASGVMLLYASPESDPKPKHVLPWLDKSTVSNCFLPKHHNAFVTFAIQAILRQAVWFSYSDSRSLGQQERYERLSGILAVQCA